MEKKNKKNNIKRDEFFDLFFFVSFTYNHRGGPKRRRCEWTMAVDCSLWIAWACRRAAG